MYAFIISLAIVALAEIGDKTQLLTLMLAARFKAPFSISLGILVSTVANHLLAAWMGSWASRFMGEKWGPVLLGLSFLAMAIWILIPDKPETGKKSHTKYGVFVATAIAFFWAEMGDKTQLATVALAAKYENLITVVLGSTLGMMLANVPVAYLGDGLSRKIPLAYIRFSTSAIFFILAGLAFFKI